MFKEFTLNNSTPNDRFLGENEFKSFKIISEKQLLDNLLTLLLGITFLHPILIQSGQSTQMFPWDESLNSFQIRPHNQLPHLSPISLSLYLKPFLSIASSIRQFELFIHQ